MNTLDTIVLPQGTIEFRRQGQGKTILFLHGLFLNGSIWDEVVKELVGEFEVIVPELPFGAHRVPINDRADNSPVGAAKLLADFLEALDLHGVTVVGVDFGGVVAKIATARYGRRIERLVITNCDALEVFPAKGFGYLKWLPDIPVGMFLVAQSMYRLPALRSGKMSFGAFTNKRIPDETLKSFVEPMARRRAIRRDVGKLMRGIDKKLTLALPAELMHSGKEILVLWGNEDQLFPVGLARRLTDAIGERATLLEINEARTFIAYDAPLATAHAIKDFAR